MRLEPAAPFKTVQGRSERFRIFARSAVGCSTLSLVCQTAWNKSVPLDECTISFLRPHLHE